MTDQESLDIRVEVPAFCDPLIKYAGAKRWLALLVAPRLHAYLARVGGVFTEPFAGSLAMGLSIGWPDSVYADTCPDLVNLYREVQRDAHEVAREVDALRGVSGEAAYYRIRESVWPGEREKLSPAAWAARTIWINKNSFNGLMRYSLRKGRFNVPWGDRRDVPLPSREAIERVGRTLRGARISVADFAHTLDEVDPSRTVVYIDPPYGQKLKNVSTRGAVDRGGRGDGVFTAYAGRFAWADQVRLAEKARDLVARGALVVASNAWSDALLDIYRDGFAVFQVGVRHSIGATGDRRGRRAEMVAISEAHAGVMESVPVKVRKR